VIHGNYDTYERMRAVRGEETPLSDGDADETRATARSGAAEKPRRKRRFPYRKVDELETDIAAQESRLRDVESLLGSPELYRDGDKVKDVTTEFEQLKLQLQQLYEHWEEAVELNG